MNRSDRKVLQGANKLLGTVIHPIIDTPDNWTSRPKTYDKFPPMTDREWKELEILTRQLKK